MNVTEKRTEPQKSWGRDFRNHFQTSSVPQDHEVTTRSPSRFGKHVSFTENLKKKTIFSKQLFSEKIIVLSCIRPKKLKEGLLTVAGSGDNQARRVGKKPESHKSPRAKTILKGVLFAPPHFWPNQTNLIQCETRTYTRAS